MKIAFDSYILSARFRNQGSYVYAKNLLAKMPAIAAANGDSITVLYPPAGIENDADALRTSGQLEFYEASGMRHPRAWRFGGVGRAASRLNADVLFCPVPSVPLTRSVRSVVTIHDATEMRSPSHSFVRRTIERAVIRTSAILAHRVITISECSKRDLIHYLKIPADRIDVVHNGYDPQLFHSGAPDPDVLAEKFRTLGIRQPYLLHVGTLQPRKNLIRLIQAYRVLLDRRRDMDFDLVLCGPMGWGPAGWAFNEVAVEANRAGARGKVVITGSVEEELLPLLFKGAALTVIPSLWEGFCLPMVESMACGAPTIVSNNSCFPEISDGVLRYFDPLEIEDMAATMEAVLDSEEMRAQLSKRGIDRAQAFSWERCARETLKVLTQH